MSQSSSEDEEEEEQVAASPTKESRKMKSVNQSTEVEGQEEQNMSERGGEMIKGQYPLRKRQPVARFGTGILFTLFFNFWINIYSFNYLVQKSKTRGVTHLLDLVLIAFQNEIAFLAVQLIVPLERDDKKLKMKARRVAAVVMKNVLKGGKIKAWLKLEIGTFLIY